MQGLNFKQVAIMLSQGVNFINVLRTNFSYKRRFSSYVLAFSKNSFQKIWAFNIYEIDGRWILFK